MKTASTQSHAYFPGQPVQYGPADAEVVRAFTNAVFIRTQSGARFTVRADDPDLRVRAIARACAEDNSGTVKQTAPAVYTAAFSYPIDETPDGLPVYAQHFSTREAAVECLRDLTGWTAFEQRGPGF